MKLVKDILSLKGNQVWSVSPNDTVLSALQVMAEKDIGALMVIEDSQIVGIISERDYARKIILHGKSSLTTPVMEIMTPKVYYVNPNNTIEECLALMTDHKIRHTPVLENGELVGILSIGDVVKVVIDEQASHIIHLNDYISGKYMN